MSEREWLGNLDSSARRAHELTAKRQLLSASTLFAKSCRGGYDAKQHKNQKAF